MKPKVNIENCLFYTYEFATHKITTCITYDFANRYNKFDYFFQFLINRTLQQFK